MIKNDHDPFLPYYHRELSYLRKAGKVFAEHHPKIARRLDLSDGESPDPHVERLLESFAFLTARLSQEIDDRLPQLASALLSVLYPHLTAPIPSVAICQFNAAPGKGKMTSGFDIPRQTSVFSHADEGITCRFQTVYPVTLWPISVVSADVVPADAYSSKNGVKNTSSYLRLKLKSHGLSFSDLQCHKLVFHLNGDPATKFALYEGLFSQSFPQVLCSDDGQT